MRAVTLSGTKNRKNTKSKRRRLRKIRLRREKRWVWQGRGEKLKVGGEGKEVNLEGVR